ECVVEVSQVDELELRVQVMNGNHGAHAVWVEPRLLQRLDSPDPNWPPVKKLFGDGPRTFLSELSEFNVKAGQWPLGTFGDKGDGKQLQVDGKASPMGLGMHPPRDDFASVSYRLDRQAALFKGAVALDDNSGHVWINASATFEVWGDGKRLW